MTEETIFAEALRKPAGAERAAFLAGACRADPALRRRVEGLLASHELALGFPSEPAPAGPEAAETQAGGGGEAAGALIGRYRLLQEIGRGGFGTVWMAEQREPVKRKVALKVIKLGMDTRQVVARFEAERQALAMMDHPNIAKVLDAGATDAGRPYFVMELVRGVPITEYCDANNLPTRDRLGLFVAVCRAIQHAHTKGVIHRDVKPSNVLVTMHDGVPVPKVIDFGIAKATGADLTDRTLFTEFRQMIGTPAYMSPEQAEMSGLDIDTRSDVYSLGVLLYELLTGTTPLDARELMRRGLGEIQRIIREEEAPRPSTRLSTLGAGLTEVARHRGTEPRKLSTLVRGDLDWIVMKALEKDRTRRYETANGLAQDVARHLADEPVVARPAGAGYRVRKFVRRHTVGAAAVLAVAVALILGIVGTTAGMFRARASREAAEHARLAAEDARRDADDQKAVALRLLDEVRRAKGRADAANAFMRNMFGAVRGRNAVAPVAAAGASPGTAPPPVPATARGGADVKVIDVLRDAAAALDRMTGASDVQFDGRMTLGATFEAVGMNTEAVEQYDRARLVSRALTGEDSEQTLQATVDYVFASSLAGAADGREPLARQAAAAASRRFGPAHPLTLDARNSLALLLRQVGGNDEALTISADLVRLVRANPDVSHPKGAGRYFNNYSLALREAGRVAEADAAQREAVAAAAAEPQTDPRSALAYRAGLVRQLDRAGKLADAIAAQESLVADAEHTLGASHPSMNEYLSEAFMLYERAGLWDRAATGRTRLLARASSPTTSPTDPPPQPWQVMGLIGVRIGLAESLSRGGRVAEGKAAIDAILADVNALRRRTPAFGESLPWQFWAHVHAKYGTRQFAPWASPILRDMTRDTAAAGLGLFPFGDPPAPVRWADLRYRLSTWTQAGPAPAAEGTLDQLMAASTPAPGVHLLALTIPRTGDGRQPVRRGMWLLVADWQVDLYRLTGREPLQTDEDWKALATAPPAEHRALPTLNHSSDGWVCDGFGPERRPSDWAAVARATVTPPAGRYRLHLVADGLLRAWVDGAKVYDSAAGRATPVIEFTGAPRQLRVEAANCGSQLSVLLAPTGTAAAAAETATQPWPYLVDVELEGIATRIAADPKDGGAHLSRADLLARKGQLKSACASFEAGLALDPKARFDRFKYAVLLAHLGDRAGFVAQCRYLIDHYAESDPRSGEHLVKALSILPLDRSGVTAAELAAQLPRIEAALLAGNYDPWIKMARGIYEYRTGNLWSTGWLEEAEGALNGVGHAAAACKFYRAMVLYRRGDVAEADRARAAALEIVRLGGLTPEYLTDGKRYMGPTAFHDYIILQMARREADDVWKTHPAGWRFETPGGGSAGSIRLAADGSAEFTTSKVGELNWQVQGIRPGLELTDGRTYVVKFRARADADRTVVFLAQADEPDWGPVGFEENVQLSTAWADYEYRFTAKGPAAGTRNQLGCMLGLKTGTVWVRDLTVTPG